MLSEDEIRQQAIVNMERSPEEEATVQKILQDQELQSILADPEFRKILQQCSEQPHVFQQYLRDKTVGPKLQKMMSAGLVTLQQ